MTGVKFPRWALLLLPVFGFSSLALSQAPDSDRLGPDQLQYYLMQAFHADSAENRRPLNHIGIQVQPSATGYLVTAVLEGYPAHLAGINRGDVIHSVDTLPYHPVYSFNTAAGGPGGFPQSNTSYEITWRRNDSTLSASLIPVYENLYDSYRSATLNSIQVFPSGNKLVGYVRLWGFSRSSNDLASFRQILAEFDDCDGLIIDLRNAYGFLAHQHLDLLFPSRRRRFQLGGVITEHVDLSHVESAPGDDYFQKPIAVLLNSATEGGAELLAYQLAKLERVITVGEATPGRIGDYRQASAAESAGLEYRPAVETLIDGRVFESSGVQPQQVVPYPFSQSSRGDPQYQAALLTLLGII
ncbi:MAG: hypothetical protein IIB72_14150 [Proteobacteria bacterium]|nr:hypothetical protein [Pseudomonadota bacterium]